MNLSGKMLRKRLVWAVSSAAVFAAGATLLYPAARGKKAYPAQEKEAARPAGDQSTNLNDQTDLNVTVYNSNIALIRDVRQLTLPGGGKPAAFLATTGLMMMVPNVLRIRT